LVLFQLAHGPIAADTLNLVESAFEIIVYIDRQIKMTVGQTMKQLFRGNLQLWEQRPRFLNLTYGIR